MRAVVVTGHGGLDRLDCREHRPGPGEAPLRVGKLAVEIR